MNERDECNERNERDEAICKSSYLSKRGYVIRKPCLSESEMTALKHELTVVPLQDSKYATFDNSNTFHIYIETRNKMYIPKMYGIRRYGEPSKLMPNYIGKPWQNTSIEFTGTLFDSQLEPVNALLRSCKTNGGGILKAGTGSGKCHKIDTPILMFDGTTKLVQNIVVGDLLMGDDSTPRRVLSLARGRDIMYDIVPVKGDRYTVNQEHILCLRVSSKPRVEQRKRKTQNTWQVIWFEHLKFHTRAFPDKQTAISFCKTIDQQEIVEISVRDYLQLSKRTKHILKGYKVAVDFIEKPLAFDPYIIGLWLGDGTSQYNQITNQDSKILHYLTNTLPKFDCYLKHKNEYVYNINGRGEPEPDSNKFLNELGDQNLLRNKHIPDIYKCNSRTNRLRLLAGLIDAAGYLNRDNCTFYLIQKSERMIDDIIFLVQSLGFACYKSKQNHCLAYRENDYYRISISGNTSEIPTLCSRKRVRTRSQIKNVLNTGITVNHVGVDDYYGFEIDGNHRYLLGDFTVTHNTFMTINVLSKLKQKTIVVVNKIPLMKQWESEINRFLPGLNVGFIQGQKNVSVEDCDIVIGMLQSLARIDYPDDLFQDFAVAVIDECHNTSSRVFSKVLGKLCCRYTIGLSATPKRSDGCEHVFKYYIGDIIYESQTTREGLPPIIRSVSITSKDYREIMSGNSQIQFTSMLTDLTVMPKRNCLIVSVIKRLVTEGRKILVLSDRREHLKTLQTIIHTDPDVTFTYGLFLGQMKQRDLEKSRASQVILATFSAFGEGVSERDLDTLLLVTPKKFIGHLKNTTKNESGRLEQIVGRIFRKNHTERNPLIVDFQDNFSVYRAQSAQRNAFYRQHFKKARFEPCTIDLDPYTLETLHADCIVQKNKRNVVTEESIKDRLIESCVIDD